jgi:hypothetical protein
MAKPSKAELHEALREYMRGLAAKGGRKGGPARAKSLTAAQRSELARKAVLARWAKAKKIKTSRKG